MQCEYDRLAGDKGRKDMSQGAIADESVQVDVIVNIGTLRNYSWTGVRLLPSSHVSMHVWKVWRIPGCGG